MRIYSEALSESHGILVLHHLFLQGEAGGGSAGLSLGGNRLAGLISLGLLSVVGLDSLNESGSALTGSQMLHSDVDSLGDDPVAHQFVDDDTDGAGIHVEHLASAAVVELERHALIFNGFLQSTLCWDPSTTTST